MNGALANRTSAGYGPLPQPQLEAEAEDLSDLANRQSSGRHAGSPISQIGKAAFFPLPRSGF